ncbi:MAG: hypothetical protein BRD55_05450 [Bacteroidetes bacterium SW_9_63_38]|nr:MAG: hypothetical protein BRD55_05450 [Bacteroidetes bacterium SW_9_63_38]
MNTDRYSSPLRVFRPLALGALVLILAGALTAPLDAMGQTCYSVNTGDWETASTWADNSGGAAGSCSASSGYPTGGENAVIENGHFVQIDTSPSTALDVGDVTVKDDGTLQPSLTPEETRSFTPVNLEVLSDGAGGALLEFVNSGSGRLDITASGTFKNEETVTMTGQSLSVTGLGDSRNQGSITVGDGGVLDVDDDFFNDASGSLDYTGGTLEFGSNFQNSGTVTRDKFSLAKFDGGGDTQTISGSNLTGGNGGFSELTVTANSKVDPSPDNGKILVTGALTVNSGGQYGTDPAVGGQEDADLRYEGESFSVDGTLFADVVEFAADNIGSSYTTVAGAIFAKVDIINNTAVEVGTSSFTVNGPVFVNSGNALNVSNNGTSLELASDFQNNGTIEASGSGTIKFNGEGKETDCSLGGTSDLTCARDTGNSSDKNSVQEYAGASATYNALRIQDGDGDGIAETDVKFADSGSPVVVDSDLIIKEASLEAVRPIELNNGNLDVRTDGTIDFSGDRVLTLSGSNPSSVTTQDPLSIAEITVDKFEGTATFNNDVTVAERLSMLAGTVEPAGTLTIENVLQLGDPNVNSTSPVIDVTAGGGTLKLVSDGGNDAYVEYVDSDGDGTSDGSIAGPVTYQRYLNGSVDWYYMATPDGTNTTFDEFLQQGPNSNINDLRTRGVTGADDKENNSLFASVRLYDESEPGPIDPSGNEVDAGWKAIDCEGGYSGCVTGLGDPMQSGHGYAVYGYKDDVGRTSQSGFSKTIDSNVESPRTNTTFDFTPLLQANGQGDGIDKNDGWNLLGNPYMTTLDFCAMSGSNLQGNNNDNTKPDVQVWDPQNGGYASYNCDNDAAVGAGSGLENGYIAPHQAFFVKATTTSPSLTINDITSVQGDTSDFFQKQAPQDSKPPAVRLQLALDDYKYTTSAAFLEDRTTGVDNSDSYYFGGKSKKSGMSFYSVLDDGTAITSNALPRDLSDEVTVPLVIDGCYYKTALQGEAEITWPTLRNLPESWGFVLKDTQTGAEIDLSSKSSHTFNYDATGNCSTASKSASSTSQKKSLSAGVVQHSVAKDGSGPDPRFELVINPDAALNSIENSMGSGSFTVRTTSDEVVIENLPPPNAGANVEVQHKPDGKENADFTTLTTLSADKSTDSHSVKKEELEPGEHTFRLLATSKSSKRTLAERTVGIFDEDIVVYPNPVEPSQQATVNVSTEESKTVTLALYNTLGQRVRILYRGEVRGTKSITIDTDQLASGVYFIRMEGDGVSGVTQMTVLN